MRDINFFSADSCVSFLLLATKFNVVLHFNSTEFTLSQLEIIYHVSQKE